MKGYWAPLFLAGCLVGPAYHVPSAPAPDAASYKEARVANHWKLASPSDAMLRGKWWEIFHEPELNALEERLNINNQTIKQYFELYMAARAQIREARAGYFPTVTANPSVTASRLSANAGGTLGATSTAATGVASAATTAGVVAPTSSQLTQYALPLEASWAPDLFGRVRNTVRQAAYGAQISAADLENQRLIAQATLAETYFELRGQDSLQEMLDQTVEANRRIYDVSKSRFDTGVDTEVAALQAEQTLQTALVQATNASILRAQYEHAIATLLGVAATGFTLPKRAHLPAPPHIPTGAPSQLLERRPDIAMAERQMAKDNASIGVGYAAYYPTLTLTGSAGFASSALRTLLSWPSRVWSLGASLSETIFDAGLRRATIDQYVAT